MNPQQHGEWPARLASLAPTLAFVEAYCAAQAVAADDALRLALVVEELFTNTVTHGHGGDADAPVQLALQAGPDTLTLHYADSAPPFDPRTQAAQAQQGLQADLAERPVGQLGIPLLLALAERIDYRREQSMNRLTLVLRRQG